MKKKEGEDSQKKEEPIKKDESEEKVNLSFFNLIKEIKNDQNQDESSEPELGPKVLKKKNLIDLLKNYLVQ
jgi:hypothetical protein